MAKSPIERKAGQTVEEMACQMEASKAGNRMYKAQYNEVAAELKAQQFDAIIGQQAERNRFCIYRGWLHRSPDPCRGGCSSNARARV